MLIRSKTLRWLIILSTVIVAIIIAVQLYWLQKIYKLERRQFNSNVSKSIKNLLSALELSDEKTFTFEKNIELPLPEAYVARISRIPSIDSVATILSKELTDYNLLADCNISIFDPATKTYIETRYIDMPNSYSLQKDKFTNPVFNRTYAYINIYFPNRQQYILSQMLFWIISGIILTLFLIGFGVSVFYLHRQRFLNEIQKDFVNNFTHEFKTPLSVIKIAADVLQQPSIIDKPQKLKNYADIIQEQTTHLQNQLNRMLTIAYTEHSALPLKKENFDANKLVEQAVNNIYPLLETKSGELSMNFKSTNTVICADKSYLLLAYTNILENAVKYSLKPEIEITTYIDGNDFCTDFSDNGIGIDPKQHKKIYDKFYRVTVGDIHQAKGFGLGLNFVKKIMDAHKGTISVESKLGIGSNFTLKVPRG